MKTIPRCWLAVFVIAAWAAPAGALDWRFDIETARSEAATANRSVLLDFWADWCVPCRAMDAQAWGRPGVVRAAAGRVLVRSDFGLRGTARSDYYSVSEIPTLLALDSRGGVALRVTGFRGPDELERLLLALPRRLSEIDSLVLLAGRPVEGLDEGLERAALLSRRACNEPAAALYARLLQTREALADAVTRERVEYLAAENDLQARPAKAFRKLIKLVERSPRGPWRRQELVALVRGFAAQNLTQAAQHYLEVMREEFPDDSLTFAAESLLAPPAKH